MSAQGAGHGYFHNAHNFSVQNSAMYDIGTQINHYHKSINALEALAKYTIVGVEFDSSARDPPPRCHPDTRKSIVQSIQAYIRDPNPEKRVLWLYGPAGVGKSAIIQTLAESESPFTLGATVFFSRAGKRNNPARICTTIAYQLAVRIPAYRAYIDELLATDPKCLEKSMAEQFRILIVTPFAERRLHEGPVSRIIFLDGLDECQGEREQCAIIALITGFVLQFPSVALIWIIASRAASHLRTFFSRPGIHLCCWKQEVSIDSDACEDVKQFLRDEFTRIQQEYPDLLPSTPHWPDAEQFRKVELAAAGLFIYASTIARFIGDPEYGNPASQLNRLLSVMYLASTFATQPSEPYPLYTLDALYTQIMSDIPRNQLLTAQQIIGYYCFDVPFKLSDERQVLQVTCNILGLERHVAYSVLRKLHSVLELPSPEDACENGIMFFHSSFLEYLRDPTRSHDYSISLESTMSNLCSCFSRILKQLTKTSPDRDVQMRSVQLSWPSQEGDAGNRALRRVIVTRVLETWVNTLHSLHVFWGLPTGRVSGHSPEFQTAAISSILEIIDFSKLVFYTLPDGIVTFWTWFQGYAPARIVNRLIVTSFPLKDLDMERALIHKPAWFFEATQERYASTLPRWQIFWPEASTEFYGQRAVVSALLDDVPPLTEVTVLGTTSSQCCAVVEYQDPEGLIVRCFFPYSVE